ncbi:MFS transporter [Candidatus Pacearchaeota archaeon]|nr:MFS transporter [Candidatus Pacearchaeota archaeon]
MGLLLRRHYHTRIFRDAVVRLAFVIFTVSLASSLIDTIWSVYVNGFFHNESLVGFFSGFLSVLSFLSFFFIVPLVARSNKSVLYSLALITSAFLYVIFAVNKNLFVFIVLSIAISIIISIKITTAGIMVKDKSDKKSLSKNEGVVYSFNNVAWVLGPLLGSLILVQFGHSAIFFAAALLIFLGFILFKISGINDSNKVKNVSNNVLGNFFDFFRDKERVISYIVSLGVTIWWSLIYLYIPLFIIDSGLKEKDIGIFLFFTAIPLILFEYVFSRMAGKYGFKKFFLFGYIMVSLIALIAFFMTNVYWILGILVLGSVGMAMLEPTTEAYFFKILKSKKDENRFYGPYNTAIETGLIIGKFAPAVFLVFFPFKSIFLLYSILLFAVFAIALKARNIAE